MRIAVAQPGVAAPIAKSVELLDIAQRRARLLRNPFAQAAIKSPVADGIKGTRRQSGKRALALRMHG